MDKKIGIWVFRGFPIMIQIECSRAGFNPGHLPPAFTLIPTPCDTSGGGMMAMNSPGKKEEDPERAIYAKRQDGVKEAG